MGFSQDIKHPFLFHTLKNFKQRPSINIKLSSLNIVRFSYSVEDPTAVIQITSQVVARILLEGISRISKKLSVHWNTVRALCVGFLVIRKRLKQ